MFWLKNDKVNFLLRTLYYSPDNTLFILQAFSEFTFEPSWGELKPLETKKVKVTFQPVSAKSVRRVIEVLRIIFCFFLQAFSEFTFEPSGGELKPLESKKVMVTFQPVKDNILYILQAFSEFTFEPSGGELRPLESKKVKVTFQPVSAKSVRHVIEEFRIIFCLFCRPLVSLHLSHPAGS